MLSASRTDPAWYRFQSVALTWSRCYAESDGKLSCVTCHDPHRNADPRQRGMRPSAFPATPRNLLQSPRSEQPRRSRRMQGTDPLSSQPGQGLSSVPHAPRLATRYTHVQDRPLHSACVTGSCQKTNRVSAARLCPGHPPQELGQFSANQIRSPLSSYPAETTSLPSFDPSDIQVNCETELLTKRTDPSAKRALTPPGWALLAT